MDEHKTTANPSGAPEAGGATTMHSMFGGDTWPARTWRFLARIARDLEATAYRRLKEMEERRGGEHGPGAPNRTRHAPQA
jgi:hypothetical protein